MAERDFVKNPIIVQVTATIMVYEDVPNIEHALDKIVADPDNVNALFGMFTDDFPSSGFDSFTAKVIG